EAGAPRRRVRGSGRGRRATPASQARTGRRGHARRARARWSDRMTVVKEWLLQQEKQGSRQARSTESDEMDGTVAACGDKNGTAGGEWCGKARKSHQSGTRRTSREALPRGRAVRQVPDDPSGSLIPSRCCVVSQRAPRTWGCTGRQEQVGEPVS